VKGRVGTTIDGTSINGNFSEIEFPARSEVLSNGNQKKPLIRYAGSAAETSISSKPIGRELKAILTPKIDCCQGSVVSGSEDEGESQKPTPNHRETRNGGGLGTQGGVTRNWRVVGELVS